MDNPGNEIFSLLRELEKPCEDDFACVTCAFSHYEDGVESPGLFFAIQEKSLDALCRIHDLFAPLEESGFPMREIVIETMRAPGILVAALPNELESRLDDAETVERVSAKVARDSLRATNTAGGQDFFCRLELSHGLNLAVLGSEYGENSLFFDDMGEFAAKMRAVFRKDEPCPK